MSVQRQIVLRIKATGTFTHLSCWIVPRIPLVLLSPAPDRPSVIAQEPRSEPGPYPSTPSVWAVIASDSPPVRDRADDNCGR
jgi:hypothetical protein